MQTKRGNATSTMSSSNDSKPDNYQINAKICRLVERYPCMYDRSHKQYSKKDAVDMAWVKISKEMDDSIPSCKDRWRNIRTSFARSINVNKVPASANRTKPYYLHEELQFLARHITPGIPVSRRSYVYYSGEESEAIEVSVGEESFDGFAPIVQDEDESQGQQSSADEGNEATKIEEDDIPTQPQPAVQPATSPTPPPPAVVVQAIVAEHMADDIPIAHMYPPKKRQRMLELPVPEVEVEKDIKPAEILPDSDFDAIFLQGLLPEMKAMDFRQKIIFKRRIYEAIGEIFDNSSTSNSVRSLTVPTTPQPTYSPAAIVSTPPTMAVVNAADLAMIRRLNCLLQNPSTSVAVAAAASSSSSAVTAVPKSVASISSTVRTTPPGTATVAVHRGALTRSSTNLLRVTMVNPPVPNSSSQHSNSSLTPQLLVKQEPEVLDD